VNITSKAAAMAAALAFAGVARAQSQQDAGAQQQPSAASAGQGQADDRARKDAERKALEEQIQRELGGGGAGSTAAATRDGASPPPAQAAPASSAIARVLLLPDISAIGSLTFSWDDQTHQPTFHFEELELALQAVVDPYLRADVFISFADGGVDVEEAYVTTLAFPAGFQLRAGILKSPFGRLNQTHPHVQEFIEAPLPTRLLANEALSGAGIDVAWLAPLPWFAELHLALQNTAPFEGDPSRFTGVGRLNQFFGLSDAATLGVGLSAARRSEAPGQFRDLAGADVYLRWRPPESRAYLAVTAEIYARRFVGMDDVSQAFQDGWWAQAFWRIDRFVGVGARYERAPADAGGGDEQRLVGVFAWLPSEFERIRLEASHDVLPGGVKAFTVLANLEFGIGAHGAHPF
jgi:hypothetical protein